MPVTYFLFYVGYLQTYSKRIRHCLILKFILWANRHIGIIPTTYAH